MDFSGSDGGEARAQNGEPLKPRPFCTELGTETGSGPFTTLPRSLSRASSSSRDRNDLVAATTCEHGTG